MSKIFSKIGSKIIVPFLILTFALVSSFMCSDNPLVIGNTTTDSSVFHYVARVILNGGMPYRDAFDHKGPLIYLIDVCGLCLNKDIGVWIIEVIFIFVALLFAYKVARLIGCTTINSIIVVAMSNLSYAFYFSEGNITEEYACTFIMLSLYIFLKFFKYNSVNFIELIACGFSFGAVCLLRINMAVLWVVMFFGVLIESIRKRAVIKFVKYAIVAFLGAAIIIIPIIIWLIKNNAILPFIEDYFVFNFIYTSDPVRASLKNIIMAICHFIVGVGIGAPIVFSSTILVYFCLRDRKLIDWLCGIALVLSVVMMCISGQKSGHYGIILIPFITYSFALFIREISSTKLSPSFKIAAVCMIALLFAHNLYFFIVSITKSLLHYQSPSFIEAQDIATIIKNNTGENDKISVCGNNNVIYLLSNRFSSSIYSYQFPIAFIDDRICKQYISDIEKLEADIIVIDKKSVFWFEELNAITDIINENYTFLKNVGTAEIYKLK